MKKIAIIFALAFTLSTASVFADHPKGLGIGVIGNWGWGYNSWSGTGIGLSLKIPSVPIFWAISLGFDPNHFGLDLSGDYYFIDKMLVPAAKLHWFLGLGGFLSIESWTWHRSYYYDNRWHDDSWVWGAFGARLPIGLSWQPLKFLEIFADVVPSLGIGFSTASNDYGGWRRHDGGLHFPLFGVGFELGLRFWI